MDWMLLAPATDSVIEEVSKTAKGSFVGDPSYVYEHVEIHRAGGRNDAIQEEVVVSVSIKTIVINTVKLYIEHSTHMKR